MPRCFSISIQSEVAWRAALRALTEPAMLIAPENSKSFSVSVVLPASGWEMMAKVRRRFTWCAMSDIALDYPRWDNTPHAPQSPPRRKRSIDRASVQV